MQFSIKGATEQIAYLNLVTDKVKNFPLSKLPFFSKK